MGLMNGESGLGVLLRHVSLDIESAKSWDKDYIRLIKLEERLKKYIEDCMCGNLEESLIGIELKKLMEDKE